MNDKKIAFILCVNDITEFEECKWYLEGLHVPTGYETELLAVSDAASMAAGYNEAMQCSDAKYKVYMHQDVFIKHTGFIEAILQIFQSNEQIGALGVIGCRHLPEKLLVAADWDAGKVLHNCVDGILDFSESTEAVQAVEAVDGLLIATQYDLAWREDIFDAWDFYDISQCMEFKRAGYKVVVPRQEDAWCYHDNGYSRLKNYFVYQKRFAEEYLDIKPFQCVEGDSDALEMEKLLENLKENIITLIEKGEKDEVASIFRQVGNKSYFLLRELSAISQIDGLETRNDIQELFWKQGMGMDELTLKLRKLKHKIKRIEFGDNGEEEYLEEICMRYSVFAIAVTVNEYAGYKEKTVDKIAGYYRKRKFEKEGWILCELSKQFAPGVV